jgi:hypothetical protein
MNELGQKLSFALGENAQVHVLSSASGSKDPLYITSTKLVELRNPHSDGSQRAPLLIFVPNDLKASAEDSFGEATFETLQLSDAYDRLIAKLVADLPNGKKIQVPELLGVVGQRKWRWSNKVAQARFLLSVRKNGYENEVIGASLFELGLIPDFDLLEDAGKAPGRLSKNLDCVSVLTFSSRSERGRVVELQLADKSLTRRLGDFLVETGVEDPLSWTSRLVFEPANWTLTFDKWKFEDLSDFSQQISAEMTEIDIPVLVDDKISDERLKPLANQRVLLIGQNGQKSFRAKFRTKPHPEKVPGVDHFKLQIISQATGGPIGLVKKKKIWSGGSSERAVTFSKLNRAEWEEGWHFVRVLAFTKAGDPVPLLDDSGKVLHLPPAMEGEIRERQINESDLFYVFRDDVLELEPTQRAAPRQPSLGHAVIQMQFKALLEGRDPQGIRCEHTGWAKIDEDSQTDGTDILEAKFGRDGTVNILVSRQLKNLEHRILKSPDSPISWRLNINNTQVNDPVNGIIEWPKLDAVAPFLTARRIYFGKLLCGDKLLLSQGADFSILRADIVEYAGCYLNLINQAIRRAETQSGDGLKQSIEDLQKLLSLDSIEADLTDYRGDRRRAILVGPTHPLRAIWLVTWRYLADHWLQLASKSGREYIIPTREALLGRLSLVNFPAVLPLGAGALFSAVDNVHPFWTLYAASNEENPRGLVAEICTALDLEEPSIGSFALNGAYLAGRVKRYLIQHPYVQTLTINCFNAGRGKVIADMLMELQRSPDFHDLHYDVRLFVPDPDVPGIGDDLGELISPSSLLAEEADAFTVPTGTHLAPKLSFSVRSTSDFRKAPSEYSAHISMLFDVFPAQEAGAEAPRIEDEAAPIHGLLQDFSVIYSEENEVVSWRRRPRHAVASPLPDAADITSLLSKLSETLSNAAANVATNQSGLNLRPVSKLVLTSEDKALLFQVHESSDWVFTIDKNLGIEFFDHASSGGRPDYLIDHSPDLSANAGRRVVITSRSLTEIEAMFERVLKEHRLEGEVNRSASILGELRTLSGRLALKLISSPTHRAEALGLALAKIYLEYQNAFREQIVIPLDAHLDLYRALQSNSDELGDEVSFKRTDLALFEFDANQMIITCRLVEVKCYQETGGVAALNELKNLIADQIQQSEQVIRFHFDPERGGAVDRPDREVKTHEFITLLEFYVDRAARLGVLTAEVCEEAKYFLRSMERGYRLRFTRSGLIFDFAKTGSDEPVEEGGIEFHRVGFDLIRALVRALPARKDGEATGSTRDRDTLSQAGEAEKSDELRSLEEALPRLPHAAFIAERRPHTVSWDTLRERYTEELEGWGGSPDGRPVIASRPPGNSTILPSREAVEPQYGHEIKPIAPRTDEVVVAGKGEKPDTPTFATTAPGSNENDVSRNRIPEPELSCDILLGETQASKQFGLLGKVHGRTVGLDLNQTHTISLFGVQGGGKSYTLGSIIEMASLKIPQINVLPSPLASIVFHYSNTQDYRPEFVSMNRPNSDVKALKILMEQYGATPAAMRDIVLLTPEDKLEERRIEFPEIEILPLKFSSNELQASHWRFLMGAVGNQAAYIRQLGQIMRKMRNHLTLVSLRAEIDNSNMPEALKQLANMRLDFASTYLGEGEELGKILRPGRLVIVDLRDEFIEKDEALGLFVVILQIFAEAQWQGRRYNKLVVFDEAHKYIDNPDLVSGLVEVVREMRHKGTSILVASQDPPSVPIALIELSSQIIMHRFNSPAWLRHLQKANAALSNLLPENMARLNPGEAYIWSSKATDKSFSTEAIKVVCRPRVTEHGGSTKTALNPD